MYFLSIGYFVIAAACVTGYAVFCRSSGVRFVSYSVVVFALTVLLHVIPGWSIATGSALPDFNRGFDEEVYWIYIALIVLLTVGLVIGRLLVGEARLALAARPDTPRRMNVALIAILLYTLAYLTWLGFDQIPLNDLIVRGDLVQAYLKRMQVTHQLGELKELPFFFRYWRVVMQVYFLIVFIYFLQYARKGSVTRVALLLAGIVLAYNHLFTLEKAPLISVLAAMYFLHADRRTSVRTTIVFAVAGLLAVYGMYVIAMGPTVEHWFAPFQQAFQRLQSQSSSVYLQIQYVREHGTLWIEGLNMQFASALINTEHLDPSVWAAEQMAPALAAEGYVGAAGGNAFAQLYFVFSWLAIPLFFVFVVVFAAVDQLLANTLRASDVHPQSRTLLRAFYIGMLPDTSLAFAGTVFGVFGLPLGLNSGMILIVLFFLVFVDPRSFGVRLPALRVTQFRLLPINGR